MGFWLSAFLVSGTLGLILVAALFTQTENRLPNRLLAVVVLLALLNQAVALPSRLQGVDPFEWIQLGLDYPFVLLIAPLLYLYIVCLTTREFCLNRSHLKHLIPFFVGTIWTVIVLSLRPATFEWEPYARHLYRLCVGGYYVYLAEKQVTEYEARLQEVTASSLKVTWLKLLLLAALAAWILNAGQIITGFPLALSQARTLLVTLTLFAIGFFALRYSAVFAEARGLSTRSTKFSPEDLKGNAKLLTAILESEKLYLDPELRLSTLAERMKLRPDEVSEVLRDGVGMTFFNLINRYRVREAEHRLRDSSLAHLSILGIAMDCGFNSKSSFAEAFKKWNGKTPSEYRQGR